MKITPQTILIILFLTACSPKSTQPASQPSSTSTETPRSTETLAISTPSSTPAPTRTKRPTATPTTQPPAEATLEAYGTICEPPAQDYQAEISPDGLWIAMVCEGKADEVNYLRVVSIQGAEDWIIQHADYANDLEDHSNGLIYPFHWSTDGKYLYVTSPSRGSGCCWIGWDLLLVRLNLESGNQTEIANYLSEIRGVDFSISPSDRYVLHVPPDGRNHLHVLDLYTWKQRVIKLEFENTGAGYILMSNNERKIILVLREYPEEHQGDLTFGSLIVIDLESGLQKKVLSGMDYHDTPRPVRWKDDEHVLLCNNGCSDGEFSLLNISTGELRNVENP